MAPIPPGGPPSFASPILNAWRNKYRLAFGSGAPVMQQGGGFSALPTDIQPQQPSINDQVLGIINPQLQAAADMINRRSSIGSQMISQYTQSYANLVGKTAGQIPKFYKPEMQQARGVAQYAQGALTSAGQANAASLGADLGQAGVHGPGDINLSQQGAGAGAAAYGTGIAELDALIARKAAASAEAALEPSFAAGMGQQAQGIVAMQLARQLADFQGQIASQVPGLVSDLTQQQYQRQTDQRDFEERVREYNQSRADQIAAQKAADQGNLASAQEKGDTVAYGRARDTADRLTKNSAHVYLAVRGKNGQWTVQDMGPKAGTAGKPTKLTFQTINGRRVSINPVTGAIIRDYGPAGSPSNKPTNLQIRTVNGQDVAIDPATGNIVVRYGPHKTGTTPAGKAPTPNQLSTMVDNWYGGKQTTRRVLQTDKNGKPIQDSNGAPIYRTEQGPRSGQLTYQQAYKRLKALNVTDEQARGVLDTKYKRGERGRPWVSVAQRTTLQQHGLLPRARYYKGHAYLEDRQVTVLKAANMLPAGEWVGGRYFIKPGY